MFFGNREDISESETRDWKGWQKLRRMRLRDPKLWASADTRRKIEERVLEASKNVRIQITRNNVERENGMPSSELVLGSTIGQQPGDEFHNLWLSVDLVASLLKPNLTTGERATGTYFFDSYVMPQARQYRSILRTNPVRARANYKVMISVLCFSQRKANFVAWQIRFALFER